MLKSRRHKRAGQSGQAITEGAAMLVVLTIVFVGFLLLMICTGTAIYYQQKVSYAAMAGAKAAVDNSTWLGNPRPNYPSGQLTTDVSNAVQMCLAGMHLPAASSINVTSQAQANGQTLYIVTVQVDNLPIPGAGLFPHVISAKDTVAFPTSNLAPPAVIGLQIGSSRSVYVPAYGEGVGWTNGYQVGINQSGNWAYYNTYLSPGIGGDGDGYDRTSPSNGWIGGGPFSGWQY